MAYNRFVVRFYFRDDNFCIVTTPTTHRCDLKKKKEEKNVPLWKTILTFPPSTLRAAESSDWGITPFSAPKVLTADETPDGIDSPCEFSARIKNMYVVAGLSSPIYWKIKWNSGFNFTLQWTFRLLQFG